MYYCFHEFHPFWFEFIKLDPTKRIYRKRWLTRQLMYRNYESRGRDYAGCRRTILIQLGTFVVTFLLHWNPVPASALDFLARHPNKGRA